MAKSEFHHLNLRGARMLSEETFDDAAGDPASLGECVFYTPLSKVPTIAERTVLEDRIALSLGSTCDKAGAPMLDFVPGSTVNTMLKLYAKKYTQSPKLLIAKLELSECADSHLAATAELTLPVTTAGHYGRALGWTVLYRLDQAGALSRSPSTHNPAFVENPYHKRPSPAAASERGITPKRAYQRGSLGTNPY